MNRYEILILTIPELTKDEESSLENQLEKFINDHKGSIISFDRWGKYRLAYPVKHNDYGVYFLMRFEVKNEKDFLKELGNLFFIKFNDIVMRQIVTRLSDEGSLEYKKPPSLEDAPKKPIGYFDKKQSRNSAPFVKKEIKIEEVKEVVSDVKDQEKVVVKEVEVSTIDVDDSKKNVKEPVAEDQKSEV